MKYLGKGKVSSEALELLEKKYADMKGMIEERCSREFFLNAVNEYIHIASGFEGVEEVSRSRYLFSTFNNAANNLDKGDIEEAKGYLDMAHRDIRNHIGMAEKKKKVKKTIRPSRNS